MAIGFHGGYPTPRPVEPSRARSATESSLFHGYSRTTGSDVAPRQPAIEPCACGLDIVAISDRPEDVQLAVRAHQPTLEHRMWRARNGL